MRLYRVSSRSSPPPGAKYPCPVLVSDSWNDYGHLTLFHLRWYTSSNHYQELGDVKILQDGKYSPNIDSKSDGLDERYCSLGQSLSYYEHIADLGRKRQDDLLRTLRDIVFAPQIGEAFSKQSGFKSSLLRFSEAEKAYREGGSVLKQQPLPNDGISFVFESSLKAASAPFRVHLNFGDKPPLPDRIVAFVGKNGTGKTWLLSRLAATLSGDDLKNGKFEPERPTFSRVIALSYSAFERFRKPKGERTFSYKYCGLYDDKGTLQSRDQLFAKIRQAYQAIRDNKRVKTWRSVLEDMFSDERIRELEDYLTDRASGSNDIPRPPLSSGQLILFTTLTQLVSLLEEQSLVLFDEPELHLHPNAIASLMRCLDNVLRRFDSYAILATHSPLIVQQIPAAYVRVFTRVNQQTFIRPLQLESFGENLTTLTDEVFQVNSDPSLYREKLDELTDEFDEDAIGALFNNRLSFNGKTVVKNLRSKKHNNPAEDEQ